MEIVETSMNFDVKTLENLLNRISKKCPTFTEKKLANTMAVVKSMKHDQIKHHNEEIEFDGARFYLGFEFFMDDIDAPDTRFWRTPKFIEWLEQEHEKMCDDLDI